MPDLFAKLPFEEAILGLQDRLAIPKDEFETLDRMARSRAFTVASVADQAMLESIHDYLGQAIEEGKSYADFAKAIRTEQLAGWTGTSGWHHRLIYEQNLGMAYSAGRVQQGAALDLQVWRYLPSISDQPRPEHEHYYGNLYRMAPGSPVPPIDFKCTCGWEWVMADELETLGVNAADLPVFNPPVPASGYVWSPSDYLSAREGQAASDERQIEATRWRLLISAGQTPLRADANVPQTWVEGASRVAGMIFEHKLEALQAWMDRMERMGWTLGQMRTRWYETPPLIRSNEGQELNRQAILAALLQGRARTNAELNRQDAKTQRRN